VYPTCGSDLRRVGGLARSVGVYPR